MTPIIFEWDNRKASENLKKHRVSFTEASTVFGDPLSITVADPDNASGEDRFVIIGKAENRKLLIVVHTIRGERMRLISARPATRHERRTYEEAST